MDMRGYGVPITAALGIGPTTVDLEIRVRMLPVQNSRVRWYIPFERRGVFSLGNMCLCLGGGKVGLAFLQVFNLAGGILRAHETAMETSDLVALLTVREFKSGGPWCAREGITACMPITETC